MTNLIYIQFDGYFKVYAYDPKSIEHSLLRETIEDRLKADNMLISDKYMIIEKEGKRVFVENTFNPTQLTVKPGAKPKDTTDDSSSWFSPELLSKMIFPLAILVVIMYQVFFKAKKASPNAFKEKPRAQQEHEFAKKFQNM